nr:hypothetical protein Iba_chr15aCG1440 [Ipomoea batatas]
MGWIGGDLKESASRFLHAPVPKSEFTDITEDVFSSTCELSSSELHKASTIPNEEAVIHPLENSIFLLSSPASVFWKRLSSLELQYAEPLLRTSLPNSERDVLDRESLQDTLR